MKVKEKRKWHVRKVQPVVVKPGRKWLWGKVLGASAALGFLLTLASQVQQIGELYARIGTGVADLVWDYGLRIDDVKLAVSASIAQGYHQNSVCVLDAVVLDLQRRGSRTDLLIKYVDSALLPTPGKRLSCDEISNDASYAPGPNVFYMFALRRGGHYAPQEPMQFETAVMLAAAGPFAVITYAQTDPPESSVYAYQHGRIELIGRYKHMVTIGNEDDDEIEVFDMDEHVDGIDIRSASGVFRLQWDGLKNSYRAVALGWSELAVMGQSFLHVEKKDTDEPVLMLNGAIVAVSDDAKASISLPSLSRIVFDPYCRPESGMKPVVGSLGAVVIDFKADDHAFFCSLLSRDVRVQVHYTVTQEN